MLCGGSEQQAKFRSLILGEEESRLIDLEMLLNTHVHTYTHHSFTFTLMHRQKPGHKTLLQFTCNFMKENCVLYRVTKKKTKLFCVQKLLAV